MVYPASLDFLIGYGERFQPMITIGEYTKLFATIVIGLGLMFEMPILVFSLALMRADIGGIVMWRNVRYSGSSASFVVAIITPTADILEHVSFRGAADGAIRRQHRRGVAGRSPARERAPN